MRSSGRNTGRGFLLRGVLTAGRPLAVASGLFVVASLWVLALRGADVFKAADLAGVFCFAYVAACGGWKTVGFKGNPFLRVAIVATAALLTGCGGGALIKNPVLYGNLIPYPVQQPEYLAAVTAAILLSAIDLEARISGHSDVAAAADAIAHALFTLTAAEVAIETFGPTGIGVIAAIFAAFASTAGGGIIRDLILDWLAGSFKGFFPTLCAPYRWSSLFGAVLVVTMILTAPAWAWVAAAASGMLIYSGRNFTLSRTA